MRTKKLKDGLLIYSRKLPEHSGEFVRKMGGYEKYWEHLRVQDVAAPVYDLVDGKQVFIGLRKIKHPIKVVMEKIGRNELCPCKSGKKFKKCCINKDKPKQEQPKVTTKVPKEWVSSYTK